MDAHFIGVLRLSPDPANPNVTLIVDSKTFAFIDKHGVRWDSKRGDVVGGAHIPMLLKPIVGHSFQEPYLRAATLHDIYCDKSIPDRGRSRTWQATHRMFYDAMIVSGVNIARAFIMWSAVYTFGPKW